jgi:polysaccharide chain length determinant protein (PEP-CTERM system associated)
MTEEIEEKTSEPFDIQYLLGVVRRRHIQFLIPLFLGWLLVWGASWLLPARYKSGTLILVEQPTMPKEYVVPNVRDDLQDRLQSITQQILSRTRLLLIIDQMHLYSGHHYRLTTNDKVERMRKDIDIELVRDSHEDQITAFNIYYTSYSPIVAQKVTGELTNLFINANLEVRRQESEDTTAFLESQLVTASTSLAGQESKIETFKGEHMGELPAQQASNLQILSGLQSELVNEQDALNTAQQQRVYLQTLINQYRTLQVAPGKSGDTTPTRLRAIDQEIDKLKSQLADLRSHYTESYPDVRDAESQLARTQKLRDSIANDLMRQGSASSQADENAVVHDFADPARSATLLQLQSQIQANQAEIANRDQSVAGLKAKINDYQDRLNQEPIREQQMADLTRGYDQSKSNYDDLLKKKNESEMATSMEQLQQGERFIMLDPPNLPQKPSFPNRLKFCGFGLGFGLFLGALVAGGMEFMDDRLHKEKDIRDILPTIVIAEIPEISTPFTEQRKKMRGLLGWGMAVLVLAAIMAGSAFNYLRR